jgi:aminocarboxymuconate-semialdehyde decarboxylase
MTSSVIDVHTHLLPDLAQAAESDGVRVDEDGTLTVDGHRLGMPALYDAEALAAFVVRTGLDAAWVSPPPPMYRAGLDAADAAEWAGSLNEGMRRRVDGHAGLGQLAYLPFDHPEAAVAVAQEWADVPGAVGWTASAGGASVPLDAVELKPLWRLLEELGRPVLLHPGESPDVRLTPHYLSNLLGNPVETGLAVAQLVLGGVLDRNPGLRIVLVHCAGVVPGLVGRWSRGVATQRPGIAPGTMDPAQTVRSLWTDCLAHHPAVVDLALDVMGADRLLLGSDYPFPMGLDNPFDSIAHLDAAVREQIAGNAGSLLSGVVV